LSDSEKSSAVLYYRLPFSGIAALSVTFFLAVKKKVTKEKLPAAPASVNVGAYSWVCAIRARRCRLCRSRLGSAFIQNTKKALMTL